MSSIGLGGFHDVGGTGDSRSIDFETPPYEHWELQVSGLVSLLVRGGNLTIYELRRCVEGLPEPLGTTISYYEKWALALTTALLERGVITHSELNSALGRTPTDYTDSTFVVGDAVVVRGEEAALWFRKPHIRTPGYLFGCVGEVVSVVGNFEDPELAAFREPDARQPLYRAKFTSRDVWANAGLLYEGPSTDTIVVDITQPWLARHEGPAPSLMPGVPALGETAGCAPSSAFAGTSGTGSSAVLEHGHDEDGHHHHDHDHDHDHGNESGAAPHSRVDVEQTAVDREGLEPRFKPWAEGVLRLLVSKGVVTFESVNQAATNQAEVLGKAYGPMLVAKAWVDPEFKARLLQNAHAAAAELGINATNPAAPTVLQALENTDTLHNLVVCTLCSCYPQAVLGLSPQWYRSRSYRARCVREPRAVLAEFGTTLSNDVEVRVHDSTSELRFIVIPKRPDGTDGWTEERLRALVTRDSMIGVSEALPAAAAAAPCITLQPK